MEHIGMKLSSNGDEPVEPTDEQQQALQDLKNSYTGTDGELAMGQLIFLANSLCREGDLSRRGFNVFVQLFDSAVHALELNEAQVILAMQGIDRVNAAINGDKSADSH